ncbi:YhdP family protein [Piscinibacter sakaiensis]|uniref:Putative exported protein n=1 Tax=Piscinibacter sakaiensis TaxID=1547922 RepID=A0A0K8P5B9_PISS1|nr:YhdP family protein [Piscinibacter sakaiensis]GAP37776.1 putative exported protein [Piscinibacter sakaiensis]
MSSLTPSNFPPSASPDRDASCAAAAAGPGLPLRCWRLLARVLRAALLLLAAVWSVLLLLWLVLHWGILPHIDRWRGTVETRASEALGVPVRLGEITVSSSGWVPSLEMRDVRLLDAQQRPALVLPRVVAALSPRSLLARDLRFQQLYLEGARLEVRRDARGRVFVAGFDLDANAPDPREDSPALRWFLKQPEFVIRGGSLRWTDELRGAPPLVLDDVQLVLRNGLRQHLLRLDATPPPAWGERFTLRGRFTQPLLRGEDFHRWSGTAHAELPRADVRELRRYVQLPFDVEEGDGALRAWVDLREGVPVGATVDLALRAVRLRVAPGLEPLELDQVEGRLDARRQGRNLSLEARQLGFQTGDGLRWPRGDLRVAWREGPDGRVAGGEIGAGLLDLHVMAEVAAALPLGAPLRRLLAETRPQGQLRQLALRFDGPPDAPSGYQVQGELDGLALAASRPSDGEGVGRPGLRNARLQLKASERGGEATLRIERGALEFPGVFDEPQVPMDTLAARLNWRIDPVPPPAGAASAPPRVQVDVKDARFANADAEGSLSATWRTGGDDGRGAGPPRGRGARLPGVLQIDGQLLRGQAARTARYLPRGIPASARDYVADAVRGGRITQARFRVRGDLSDFPYWGAAERAGEFRIAGQVEDLTLAYVPDRPARGREPAWRSPWPPFTRLAGELIFDRAAMRIRDARAMLGSLQLSQVNGEIADLGQPTLTIRGDTRGPAAELLRFVTATPVDEWTGRVLGGATASGAAEMKLALTLPLQDLAHSTVRGSVTLAGNDLRIQPGTPLLQAARGRIDFSEQGFTLAGASARLLGGDAVIDGGSQPDGSLRFTAQGSATAEALRRAPELGLARLAGALSGQAPYRLVLGVSRGHPEILLTSSGVGLGIDLPPPLRKAPDTPLPLRLQTTLLPAEAGAGLREQLRLELGTVLQAQYLREWPREGGGEPRVLRGGLGVFERAPTPATGVAAQVTLNQVDVDAWQAALDRLAPAGDEAGSAAAAGYLPTQVALRAQQLQFGERRLNRLTAGLSQADGQWRATLDAEQMAGYLEFRPARRGNTGATAGRVYARLGRLSLPRREADQVERLLERQQPQSVPALDIVVEDLELRGKRLGRVEVEAVNRGDASDGTREWRLNRLALTTPEARLSASGAWVAAAPGARRRTQLDFRLELSDSGAFLERLGSGRAIRGGKGQLAGQVAWTGSPLSLDYDSLGGSFKVAIESGQFLKAEPGAARLLGVLSLQALPRRLSLDFRDVFQEGFAFDSVAGDVSVTDGVARTNNLRMRGVQAAVLMEGEADIEHETQNLRVVVVPEINAGTASLAYAAINPAIGLGTFLAQLVLRKPLVAAGTREFHVSGSWADPKVERVERRPGEPVPTIDDAPAADPPTPPDPDTRR